MIASETKAYYGALESTSQKSHREPASGVLDCRPYYSLNVWQGSILEALVLNLPERDQGERIQFDMNTTFISSTTANPIVSSDPAK